MMPVITGTKISKDVLFTYILKDIDIFIPPYSITGLIGASGSGKSTLLRILSLFDEKYSGKLYFGSDQDPVKIKRGIGFVNQFDILNPNLDVLNTLMYSWKIRNSRDHSKREAERKILGLLDRFNIADRKNISLKRLSGGERKRVHIINELLAGPGMLFLDEPLSGLDPANSLVIVKFLQEFAKEGNIVVMTTHSIESIDFVNDLFFLHKGRLIFYGGPKQILDYFKAGSISQCYEKVLKNKPEFLLKHFQRSENFRRLKALIRSGDFHPGTGPAEVKKIDKTFDGGIDRNKAKDHSVDKEFNSLIAELKGKKNE